MKAAATIAALGSGVAYFSYLAMNPEQAVSNQYAGEMTQQELRFINYIVEQGKSYATKEEYQFRLSRFVEADNSIQAGNSENGSYTLGHNMFSDMTNAEQKKHFGKSHYQRERKQFFDHGDVELDASVDWRGTAVGAVKNQGQCGSCWTFSGVGVIEASHYFKTGENLILSEQQIVDCQTEWDGCNGGMERDAIGYGLDHQICLESQYPYTARDGTCKHASCDTGVTVSQIYDVKPNSQVELQKALMSSPTTMAVDAECNQFMYYTSGILDNCCGINLDHAIMAVGYGSENGQDYWIVRNSWGASWGESGYIRMAAEATGNGVCGSQMETHWATA